MQVEPHDVKGLSLQRAVETSQLPVDGRGRALDNVFVERLWRSVKQEEVYLKDYETVPVAATNLDGHFRFYNRERLHQSLGHRTPESVYRGLVV